MMPECVPKFEAKHISVFVSNYGGRWTKTPMQWIIEVFGTGETADLVLRELRYRRDFREEGSCFFWLTQSQLTEKQAEAAAKALNLVMQGLGYTEDVPGRWS